MTRDRTVNHKDVQPPRMLKLGEERFSFAQLHYLPMLVHSRLGHSEKGMANMVSKKQVRLAEQKPL